MQQGRIVFHPFESNILKSNPLNDPYIRDVLVYLPPGYSQTNSKGFPAVMYLPAYGGFGKMLLNIDPFSETIEARMNRLIFEKKSGPMVLVLVDCFTKFGGSQYIKSWNNGAFFWRIWRSYIGDASS